MNNAFIIAPKQDFLSVCNAVDGVLKDKEILVVHDDYTKEVYFKLGDGIHKFSELPYVSMLEAFTEGVIYSRGLRGLEYAKIDLFYHVRNKR